MSDKTIKLYDLAAKDGKAWSANPWKIRLYLNYKKIPYTTEWVEFPDIYEKIEATGVPQNDPKVNTRPYSIPTVKLPSEYQPKDAPTAYLMDSLIIARHLETLIPSPPLLISDTAIERFTKEFVPSLRNKLYFGVTVPRIPRNLLGERAAEGFRAQRCRECDVSSLEELEKKYPDPWPEVAPALDNWAAWLKEKPEGPFFEGKVVAWHDFVAVGFLEMLRRVEPDGSLLSKFFEHDETIKRQYDACAEWLARDD